MEPGIQELLNQFGASRLGLSKLSVRSQYMLQLQASKMVNRKSKAKQDENSNLPQQDQELSASAAKEENICLKVRAQ